MSAKWIAEKVANVWMKKSMDFGHVGYVAITDNIVNIWFDNPKPITHMSYVKSTDDNPQDINCFEKISLDEVKTELERIAAERGFNYVFTLIETYDIHNDIKDHIIYWTPRE